MASAMSTASLLSLLLSVASGGNVDPRFAMNLTLYHVHPANVSSIPVNMDTGDVYGDLFFFLDEFLLPLQCADPAYFFDKFECQNPEHRTGNLTATQVQMQVDSRFTQYAGCNLCTGIDPFSRKPCEAGTYICDCMNFTDRDACDHRFVGRETVEHQFVHNVSDECATTLEETCGRYRGSQLRCPSCLFQHHKQIHASCDTAAAMSFCPGFAFPLCLADSKDYDCWHMNIARKTQGVWYSTLREGMCVDGVDQEACSWKVLETTTIPETCLRNKVVGTVESAAPDCFNACGAQASNHSSHCWISCFFGTVLGPDAHNSTTVAGLDRELLGDAWAGAFEAGACPKAPVSPEVSIVV